MLMLYKICYVKSFIDANVTIRLSVLTLLFEMLIPVSVIMNNRIETA